MPWADKEYGKIRRRELYITKNRDKIIARNKKYREDNIEKVREAHREYYYAHREEVIQRNAEKRKNKTSWYWRNREEHNEETKRRHNEIRAQVLDHYGCKCAFCGDGNPNHLSVDHVNNDGAEHRRKLKLKGNAMYRWLIANNFPDGFQLLCFTHNFEKGCYGTMTPAEFDNA